MKSVALLIILLSLSVLLVFAAGSTASPATLSADAGPPPAQGSATHTLGDVDDDGDVDAVDALFILRYVVRLQPFAPAIGVGDVDCDGDIDAVDALGILRHVVSLPPMARAAGCPDVGTSGLAILLVDKFGDGVVTSNPRGVSCGAGCSTQYAAFPAGTVVVLTASADAGSNFSYWAGCEASNGATCTVTMDSDRTVLATFASEEVVIAPTTRVLDDATMSLLRRVEGDTYYFDASASAVASLQPGDVMVSGYGEGLLRKVVSVTRGPGEIVVQTEAASLADVIEKGQLVLTDHVQAVSSASDVAIVQAAGLHCVVRELRCTVPLDVDLSDAVKISGDISFDVDPHLSVSIAGWDWSCKCFPVQEARAVMDFKGNLNLTVLANREFSTGAATSIPLVSTKQVVVVGIPVVVKLDLSLEVGITGSAKGRLESTVSADVRHSVGMHYKRETGWTPVNLNVSRFA
jgi:hypothetical protein